MFSKPESNVDFLAVTPGMHVADLGAGIGFYSIPLARAVGGNGRVYAIDIQKDLLAKLHTAAAQARLANIETLVCDVERPGGIHLKDASVDLALAANVLFQMEGPNARKSFIIEAIRIIKPKGRLAVIEWADSFGGIGPHPHDVVAEPKALELCEGQGLAFERRFSAGDHHYGLIFKKA